ncbi:hypothetical protein PGT21_008650 [Puccinia graminis f. sp. tritici]|uniref:Uncharacterized protein n=2 Tax=Puccinia graminis f. sp. tritici TaxID=56615 RepID=A0A5B0Q2D7_PUCGR|nr:hypothetical protein PGT21_008650 [Puccinia graminis f. sp. tritici]
MNIKNFFPSQLIVLLSHLQIFRVKCRFPDELEEKLPGLTSSLPWSNHDSHPTSSQPKICSGCGTRSCMDHDFDQVRVCGEKSGPDKAMGSYRYNMGFRLGVKTEPDDETDYSFLPEQAGPSRISKKTLLDEPEEHLVSRSHGWTHHHPVKTELLSSPSTFEKDIELDLALGLPLDRSEPNTKRQKVAQGSSESVARGQSGNKNQWNNPTNIKPELALGLSFDHSTSQNQKQPVSSASLEVTRGHYTVLYYR